MAGDSKLVSAGQTGWRHGTAGPRGQVRSEGLSLCSPLPARGAADPGRSAALLRRTLQGNEDRAERGGRRFPSQRGSRGEERTGLVNGFRRDLREKGELS